MRANGKIVLAAATLAAMGMAMAGLAAGQTMPGEQGEAVGSDPMIAKIREEGMQRSEVMQTLSYLANVIGPRLTGSPNLKQANEWTRDQMTKWGLANAHLESWPFNGRGWVVKRFSMQVVEPVQISPLAYPKAWSPGLDKPISANVVLMEARTEEELQKYKGKLKGAIVLDGGTRAIGPKFGPDAVRLSDTELERLTQARGGANVSTRTIGGRGAATAPGRGGVAAAVAAALGPNGTPADGAGGAGGAATAPGRGGRGGGGGLGRAGGLARGRVIQFLMQEGAAMELTMTTGNELGIIVGAGSMTLPTTGTGRGGAATTPATASTSPDGAAAPGGRGAGGGRGGPNAYALNAPESLPQVTVSIEHYNRLARMAQLGVPIKMDVDLQVQYFTDDTNAYNTIAEIPGTDLKDEVVMVGAHMDSWHMGTGTTDNGTGVSECMEAVRILQAIGLKPRRTIRVGLWSGEEEGLLGSRAYVRQHFGVTRGELVTGGGRGRGRGARGDGTGGGETVAATQNTTAPSTQQSYLPEHAKFSVYFNTDEGGGKFRGVFAGDNSAAGELFKKWLAPLADLGVTTVSPGHTTGSDHQSFEGVGLPAFNFMPDPIDYWAGTWHTSQDLYEHVVPEDMKISSIVMATCVYHAAMMDEKMPRR